MIALGEDVRDFALAVEALAEDERAVEHYADYSRTSEARGVSASSERSAAGSGAAEREFDLAVELVVGGRDRRAR